MTERTPGVAQLTAQVAWREAFTGRLPQPVITLPSATNCTVPVGAGEVGVTVAVSVTV